MYAITRIEVFGIPMDLFFHFIGAFLLMLRRRR